MAKEKRLVEAHPSLVIAYCDKLGKLLTSVYDAGYRKGKGPYPLTPNIIGENPKFGETSPFQVIVRGIEEEFDPKFQIANPNKDFFGQRVAWATPEDISLIQRELLLGLMPFQDFYVIAKSFGEGTAGYNAIYSYFTSEIPEEVISVAESNFRRQKRLGPEGLAGVFTLEELEKDSRGRHSTAHITAPVLNYHFGTKIPYPKEYFELFAMGEPRDSYTDYLKDFEYSKIKRPNHNDPTKMDPSFHEVLFGTQ